MAYSQSIKDYAKELYLTTDAEGGHKYSQEDIVRKIHTKFTGLEKYPDRSTLARWTKKKDKVTGKCWEDLWRSGQRSGYVSAVKVVEERFNEEECIGLQVDAVMRSRAERALLLCRVPDEKLKNGRVLDRDELSMVRVSELIWENLALEDNQRDDDASERFLKALKRGIDS